MNSRIEAILSEVSNLNTYDVGSVLGAVNSLLLRQAIMATINLIPELPEEGSGNDPHANFQLGMRRPEIIKAVAPLLGMAARISEVQAEYSTFPPQTLESVLEFITSHPTTEQTILADYNARRRSGNRPSGTVGEFVERNLKTARQREANIKAKGEAAVQLLNQIEGSESTDDDIGEMLMEQIEAKVYDKLRQRWLSNDDRSTSNTLPQDAKDDAQADRMLVGKAMLALGMEPPLVPSERGRPEVDAQVFDGVAARPSERTWPVQ